MRLLNLLAVLALFHSASAFGALVFVDNVEMTGTGLGSVLTILTQQDKNGGKQDPNVAGVSSGCVGYGTSGDLVGSAACLNLMGMTGGEEKTGANQTLTRSLSSLDGVDSLAQLAIVYNSSNQGNSEQVTLQQLALVIYNGSTRVFSDILDKPYTLTGFAGTGKSGYVFALNHDGLAAANAAIAPYTYGQLRVGLNALVSNDEGGNETFFVTSRPPGAVPEPATAALAGATLLSAGLLRFRFRKV